VALQPPNWWAWFPLGEFEKSQQDYGRAIPPLQRAVELDPQGSLAQAELDAVKKLAP
jgi:tetratricopeptide (TPR) repeat protein